MDKRRQTFSEEIRAACRRQPLGNNALSRLAGLDPAAVSRFITGKRWLTPASLDRLAAVLGLHVVEEKPARKKKAGGKHGKSRK